MQPNELISENCIHISCIASVAPERVMDSCEYNLSPGTLKCSVHHVSGIQGVNKVRWESSILFLFVYWLVIQAVSYVDLLDNCRNHIFLADTLVRLDTRQPQGSNPFDWLSSRSYDFSAFRKPFFDVVGISEQVSNTLNCYLGQILCSFIQFTICIIQLSVFKLPLNLLSRSNKGDTIH